MTLSDKINKVDIKPVEMPVYEFPREDFLDTIPIKDVRAFIKAIKEEIKGIKDRSWLVKEDIDVWLNTIIDELAGKELI